MLKKILLVLILIMMLSSVVDAINILEASYDSKSLAVNTQETNLRDLIINSNGNIAYTIGSSGDSVESWTLSTAWDISTGSYDSKACSVNSQEVDPAGFDLTNNGEKLYIVGTSEDTIYQYTLSTAWDVSTCSYDSKSLAVSSQESSPEGIKLGNSGTRAYIIGYGSDRVNQYALSTAWDISTGSYDSKYCDVSNEEIGCKGLDFNNDGTEMLIVGYAGDTIYQYTLSTAWDVSTCSYDSKYLSISSQDSSPQGVDLVEEGGKIYVSGYSNSIYQYSIPVVTDTCTYSGSGNWNINIADNCTISENVDLGVNTLFVNGTDGVLSIQADITAKKIQFKPSSFTNNFIVAIKKGLGRLLGKI